MPNKVVLLLLAVFALAACETSADFDQEEFDRQDRQLMRQLSAGYNDGREPTVSFKPAVEVTPVRDRSNQRDVAPLYALISGSGPGVD